MTSVSEHMTIHYKNLYYIYFQLISSEDGVNGMCYEHSVAEGIAVVSVVIDILKKIEKEVCR